MSKYSADDDDLMKDEEEERDPGVIRGDPQRARIPAETRCIINPRSEFQSKWDMVVVILLLFTAIVTPWEVAFLEPAWNGLYIVNRGVDLGFCIDLVCQFFTPYYSMKYMGFVIDHKRIACNYAKGWLSIDIISIFPFDTLGLIMEGQGGSAGGVPLGQLKLLRVIRLARLAKLLKVMKSSAIFKKWESRIGMQFSTMTMLKWLLIITFLCHWLACAWHTVISIEEVMEQGKEISWRATYGIGVSTPWERYVLIFFSSFLFFFSSFLLFFFFTLHLKFDCAHHIRCYIFIFFFVSFPIIPSFSLSFFFLFFLPQILDLPLLGCYDCNNHWIW